MLLEHERNYDSGMDALVTVCSWNTSGSMIWAWMLWSPYALGTRTELGFGHGCSGQRMLWEHERDYGWAWMLWSPYALGTRTDLWFGHGCSGQRMLWEHERDYGLGMDALVSGCSGNTNGVLGECPWSPGTWRRWIQTPSIPLNNPISTPLYNPIFSPL